MSNTSDEANVMSEIKTPEEEISAPETLDSSSSSSYKDLAGTNSIFEKDNIPHSSGTPVPPSLSHTPTISLFFLLYVNDASSVSSSSSFSFVFFFVVLEWLGILGIYFVYTEFKSTSPDQCSLLFKNYD